MTIAARASKPTPPPAAPPAIAATFVLEEIDAGFELPGGTFDCVGTEGVGDPEVGCCEPPLEAGARACGGLGGGGLETQLPALAPPQP